MKHFFQGYVEIYNFEFCITFCFAWIGTDCMTHMCTVHSHAFVTNGCSLKPVKMAITCMVYKIQLIQTPRVWFDLSMSSIVKRSTENKTVQITFPILKKTPLGVIPPNICTIHLLTHLWTLHYYPFLEGSIQNGDKSYTRVVEQMADIYVKWVIILNFKISDR